MYAGCNQVYWSPQVTGAGASVRTIKYAGASHSWDGTYNVFYLPDATSAASCGVVRWDIEPWKITSERTGSDIPPNKILEFMASCTKSGVHAGRNEQAFRQSRADVQEFVKKIFLAGQ